MHTFILPWVLLTKLRASFYGLCLPRTQDSWHYGRVGVRLSRHAAVTLGGCALDGLDSVFVRATPCVRMFVFLERESVYETLRDVAQC